MRRIVTNWNSVREMCVLQVVAFSEPPFLTALKHSTLGSWGEVCVILAYLASFGDLFVPDL